MLSLLFSKTLFFGLLAAGFFLPGWLLTRLIRSHQPWLSAFLGSAVILFHLVVGLDAIGLHLDPLSLGLSVAATNLVLLLAARWRRHPARIVRGRIEATAASAARDWPWTVPVVLALGAIATRAILDPLSGDDNIFH